jgi:formate dehydrogenase alpha subunit
VAGLAAAFGAGAMTNSISEIENTDCMLVIGSNTTGSHPIISGRMMKAKNKGAKLIVVDTRKIPLTEYADIFVSLKPGTNVAFLNGILHILIWENLIDHEFIRDKTEGFEALKEKVRGYTLEKVSDITGVSQDILKQTALTFGKAEKAMIFYAMGITQHTTGTDNVKAVANLAMATGNVGRPFTGVNPLRGQNNVQGACDMGALPNVMTGYQPVANLDVHARFEDRWGMPLSETPGLTLVEMMAAARNGTLKGMIVMGENPMISDPDTRHVQQALESLDLLVVQDIFMTETAQLAHVVLPACTFAEKEGTFTNTDRRVQRVREAISPVGESKPDWIIISELAGVMNAPGFDFGSPKEIMEEIASVTPSYGGITYDRLDNGEVLSWPCPDKDHPGTPFLYETGFARGRGLFSAMDYMPPAELPDQDYPYILSTGRIPFHFHGGSMTRRIDVLNREAPEALMSIHPEDADRLGISEGQMVMVRSRRGEITIKAAKTGEVQPGTIFIPMHFAECAVNKLTDSRVEAQAKIPDFKVCAVSIGVGN